MGSVNAENRRKRLIRLVHIGKAKMGLTDDAYRAFLEGVTNRNSCADMTARQLEAVLRTMRKHGFPIAARRARPEEKGEATPAQLEYIKGMWAKCARNKSDNALRIFVSRIAKVKSLRFLTKRSAQDVILALRDMMTKAGYDPDTSETPHGEAKAAERAFTGLKGTLASVGIGVAGTALAREGIGFQDAVVRITTSAGVFGDAADEFRRRLLQVVVDSGVAQNELVAFAQAAANGAVSLDDICETLPFMADMIQGIGLSGADAGDLLGLFFSRGADAETLAEKMNEIVAISGELGNVGVPKFVRYARGLLEESGTAGVDGIVDMFVAMNMLATGTNNASQAHYQLRSALRDLGDADVQRAIRGWTGFEVGAEGGIKNFLDVARELSEFAERRGIDNFENFEAAFGFSEATIRALAQYGNHFDSTIARIADLGDTSDAVAIRAEQNAATIRSSLNRLGTATLDFANSTLMRPIERLATLLNENPDGMRRAVVGVGIALARIAGIKLSASVASFLSGLKNLKGGPAAQGLGGAAARPPLPVFVTNMGGG